MSDVITIDKFTNGGIIQNADNQYEWTGTGVFDTIMKAVNGNIKVEFDNGRITTNDYATVYLGALQTAIGAAIDFVLREKAVEEQIAASQADTIVKQNQVAEQIAASQADTVIKQNQSAADLTLKAQQVAKLSKDILAVEEQITASKADTAIKQIQSEADLTLKNQQAAKISKDILAIEEQIASSQADTTIKQSQSAADLTLKAKQATKIDKETLSVVEQTLLYERQRQGFDDNKYQKLLETQMNSWALMFSSGLLTEKPSIITSDQASILYNHLKPQ
jgi:hypothetical protein